MIYRYTIKSEDFLQFQLFQLSRTEAFQNKIRTQQIVVAVINLGLSILFLLSKNYIFALTFIALGILWFFLYPKRIKRLYERKYSSEINEKFNKHFDLPSNFEMTRTSFKTTYQNEYSERDFAYTKEIVLAANTIYIIFKNKQTFILPGKSIDNFTQLVTELRDKSKELHIEFKDFKNWKW